MKKISFAFLVIFLCFVSKTVFAQNQQTGDSLEALLPIQKEDTNQVRLLNKLADFYFRVNINKQTLYANRALLLSKKLNDRPGEAAAWKGLASIDRSKSNFNDALEKLKKAKIIYKEINDKLGSATIISEMGRIYRLQDNSNDAREAAMLANKMFTELGNKKGIALTFHSLGLISYDGGNYPEALKYYLQSKKAYEEMDDWNGLGSEFDNIGSIYFKLDQYDKAYENYLEAKKYYEKSGNRVGLGYALGDIGQIFSKREKYSEAIDYFQQELRINEEFGNKEEICATYANIEEAYYNQKDFANALKYLDLMVNLSKEISSKWYIREAYFLSGYVYIGKKEYLKAIEYFYKSLDVDSTSLNDKHKSTIYSGLSQAYEAIDSSGKAFEYYKLHVCANDSIFSSEKSHQLTEMQTKYETEKKDKEIQLLNKENDIKALQVKQEHSSLLAAKLEADKKQTQISLLGKTREIQDLELKKQKQELEKKQLEAQVKENEFKLADNEKRLQMAEVGRQKLQKNSQLIIFLLIVLTGLFAFYRFRQVQFRRQEAERTRIARDLHDDVGATLGSISIYSEVAKNKLSVHSELNEVIEKIGDSSREMLEKMNDIVWSVNPKNDNAEQLIQRMKNFAAVMLTSRNIEFAFHTDLVKMDEMKLGMEQRKNIFLIFKEGLHNIVKYSQAKKVEVKFNVKKNIVYFTLQDDGKGFEMHADGKVLPEIYNGNGIRNMKARAEAIGASFEIKSEPGKGTCILVSVAV